MLNCAKEKIICYIKTSCLIDESLKPTTPSSIDPSAGDLTAGSSFLVCLLLAVVVMMI